MLNKLGKVMKWKTYEEDYEAWPKGYDDFMMEAYALGTVPPGYALVTSDECPPPGFKRLSRMMSEYRIGWGSIAGRQGNEPVFDAFEDAYPGYEELVCALFAWPAMARTDASDQKTLIKNASVAFNVYGKPESTAPL